MDKRTVTPDAVFRAAMPVTLAAQADQAGAVEAIVSAYGVDYRIGWFGKHRIEAGAFADSLAAQPAIPLFWEHAWSYGEGLPIGDATGTEVDEGLKITGGLYVEDSEVARVHRAMLAGAIREWSIGYRVLEARYPEDDEDLTIVTAAELLEASVVVRGANPDTQTLKVASAGEGADVLGALARLLGVDRAAVTAALAAQAQPEPELDDEPAAPIADAYRLLAHDGFRAQIAKRLS